MKIKMTADSKRIVSLEEAPAAQSIISSMKEDDTSTPADYIRQAVNALCGDRNSCDQVFEASAEIAKNCRVWNYHSDNSGTLDVWITGTAKTFDTFYIIGAYLSDLWQLCPDNYSEITQHFYVRKFTECKPA